jgi:hypothetical protein
MAHHYQVEMGFSGRHCLSSNSFLETERANASFLYKKACPMFPILSTEEKTETMIFSEF